VADTFVKFKLYFNDPVIQQNIRESKEEQFQEGFLRELFVKIFGYVINPNPDYNLTTEFKNLVGAKKADGAILKDGKAIGVIELKSTKTKELESIRQQAFDYKANHTDCVYVVTSNFEKLRFYINDAVEFEEFDLFMLSEDRFKLLYLCLNSNNLFSDLPLNIKNASILEEEQITKKFYADYSLFKKELFEDIAMRNMALPGVSKLMLYKKTQKLLDRFLFIFFAEDRGLLPPNSISRMIQRWNTLKDEDAYKPLYDIFKQYFGYLNLGRKGKVPADDIHEYNGGLFLPDELLDKIEIGNSILLRHTLALSNYDFDSQVDVNILGHIFEHSLNEIESTTAELEGVDFDKQKSKRKKDGVYYTPKYITKYIVDNTVGKLCEEKKAELGMVDEDYMPNRQKDTKKKLLAKLESYRNWLLELTICDPACGSGAFLNQALEFLIKEHHYVDELHAKLFDSPMVFQDVENRILEHNLFGVDINEESVDIARLSLWLRTAQRGRKLTTLNKNIKCGNSLIDDPEIAGDKAFNWQKEFPEVFAKGGFDVVIGNPPYLRVQGLRGNFEKETKLYETNYKSATGRFDIYVLFIEKAFSLINNSGKVSFILPHKFMVSDFGEGIRNFLIENEAVEKIIHFGAEMVFADASTYTCILCLSKNNNLISYQQIKPSELLFEFRCDEIDFQTLNRNKWYLQNQSESKLFEKLRKQPQTVKSVFENISQGVVSVGDDIFLMKGEIKGDKFIGFSDKIGKEIIIESNAVKPFLKGEDVKKYAPLKNTYFCLYPHIEKNGKTVPYEEEFFKENFPLAYNYMLPFKEELVAKKIRYKTNPKAWYSLHRSREISLFEQEKIITPEISFGTNMTIDYNNFYHNTKCYSLTKKNNINEDYRFWLAILNSKLLWFFLSNTGYVLRGGFFTFKTKYLEPFPLPHLDNIEKQSPIIENVNIIISKTAEFQNGILLFVQLIQNKFEIENPGAKLNNWHELEFKDFLKELQKHKVKFSLSEEAEWMQYFNEQKEKAQFLKAEIDKTDREIDRMVYELYGLTEEEIKIIEHA
jgi:type I restriction-modification system DNA methylase subunit